MSALLAVVLIVGGAVLAAVGINEDLSQRFLLPRSGFQRQRWTPFHRKMNYELNFLRAQYGCFGVALVVMGLVVMVLTYLV